MVFTKRFKVSFSDQFKIVLLSSNFYYITYLEVSDSYIITDTIGEPPLTVVNIIEGPPPKTTEVRTWRKHTNI